MNKRILLGIATLLAALLYACPADSGSTSSGPAPAPEPEINIEEEIQEKDPALVYKADMHESAQALFSRGDINNPYLFSLKVTSVKNLEAITGEITITGEDTVLYEETDGTINPFEVNVHTDYQTSKTTEGMYTLDTHTFSGVASIDAVTDAPSYDGATYIVGIGPAQDKPIDYGALTDDLTIHVKILHEGEVLKEETVQVSKGNRYDVTTWRDLQRVSDDLKGSYEVKNDIVFPSVGAYGYENFRPIGWRYSPFTGTFEGNDYKIEGLYMNYSKKNFLVGLFSEVETATLQNIRIYHRGITGTAVIGGLAGRFLSGVTVDNCHVYALDGAVISAYNLDNLLDSDNTYTGGLVGDIFPRRYKLTNATEIKNSSTHTDVIGKRHVGGLIAYSYDNGSGLIVDNSYTTGNVVGSILVGGLIGSVGAWDFSVIRGYTTGDVSGHESVGGLLGEVWSPVNLVGYATGKVEGTNNIGGVIGELRRAKCFVSCSNTKIRETTINAYSLSDVIGATNVGGIIGSVYTHAQDRGKNTNVITYTGYARGRISSKTSHAGLSVGSVENDGGKTDVSGYFSRATSDFIGVNQNEATGINGNSITISEVSDANYREKFEGFAFGDEVGQWTWEGNGKWPALNIGGAALTDDQPIATSSYTPYTPAQAQEEQTDKTLEGIERLKDNVFKVYETYSRQFEKQRINNRAPQADFYPTGLYIKPNRTITVTVASDTAPKNLKLLAGTYSRYEGENWNPDVFTLKVGKNTITNTRNTPRLIYIRFVEDGWLFDVATVTIDGATKHPYFIRGKTTSKEFQSMLRNYDYDSVLIASNRIMMVASKETALQVWNQDWPKTAALLDKAVERAEYIHGLDSETYYDTPPTTRILAVERSGGDSLYYAADYRISAPKESAIGWIDNSKITKDWGLWVMIGYMYEPEQILIARTTTNIYSLAIERGANQESRLVRDGTWNKIKAYLAKPAAEKKFNDLDVFIKLGMLQQLWLGHGSTDEARDKFFINLNKKIRQESKKMWTSDEALAYLMLKSSEVYGYNLNGFFKKWGVQVPQSAFDAVDALGLKSPPVDPSTLSE